MLIKCQECGLQVSDKALSCPHCGLPFTSSRRAPAKKRRRLPNGFGRITKINQNLRAPYRVTLTVGKTETGRPIGKLLKPQAYFKTYNEAYEALIEYHRNPCSLDSGITVKELYNKWSEEHFKKISENSSKAIIYSWKYCSSTYDMNVSDIRARHIRYCMEEGYVIYGNEKRTASQDIKLRIKYIWNMLLDYAMEYEIVNQNYARTMSTQESRTMLQNAARRGHISFSAEEMQTLWNSTDYPIVKIILIHCYSGWRPNELVKLKLENIDLENWSFKGGSKTTAGINRTVPIHSCIRGFVKDLYEDARKKGCEYLLGGFSYDWYYEHFKDMIRELDLNNSHRPHDCRKQFITMAKEADMNEYAIKRIVGHSIQDLTENIYTDRSLDWLSSEIEKIKVSVTYE